MVADVLFLSWLTQIRNAVACKFKAMKWNTTKISLGSVRQGERKPFSFTYLGPETVTGAWGSCTCTVSQWTAKQVTGEFRPSRKMNGTVNKNVTATLSDGTTHTLAITAEVTKAS